MSERSGCSKRKWKREKDFFEKCVIHPKVEDHSVEEEVSLRLSLLLAAADLATWAHPVLTPAAGMSGCTRCQIRHYGVKQMKMLVLIDHGPAAFHNRTSTYPASDGRLGWCILWLMICSTAEYQMGKEFPVTGWHHLQVTFIALPAINWSVASLTGSQNAVGAWEKHCSCTMALLRQSSASWSRAVNARPVRQLEGEKRYWCEVLKHVVASFTFWVKGGCLSVVMMKWLDHHTNFLEVVSQFDPFLVEHINKGKRKHILPFINYIWGADKANGWQSESYNSYRDTVCQIFFSDCGLIDQPSFFDLWMK